ncbi:MAG TPA: cytochrome c [Chthoniobacterales bacterium]|jgi:mono/diheme cytochrome c family protein
MRYFFLILLLVAVGVIAAAGFRGSISRKPPTELIPDMDRQAKYKPQKTSEFFADGRVERPPVPGTVPFGYNEPRKITVKESEPGNFYKGFTQGDDYIDTGKIGTSWGTGIPIPVTEALVTRGHQRYQINCAVCHGANGSGNGIVTQYGLVGVPSYHQARLRDMADGEIYDVIVHGRNTMMPYGDKVTREDRWAIVAYVRALQRAQNAAKSDVPADVLAKLEAK